MQKEFKYCPSDFASLPAKPIHMDLHFDIYNEYANVSSTMHAKALRELKEVSLDARDLQILSTKIGSKECNFKYDKQNAKLTLFFPKKIKKGENFTISSNSICRPTKNILEGLYYDRTPNNAPPTQITQCQQWGFQRLVPCFDDMCAKCTYTTKISADSRYTHIISNGDVSSQRKNIGNKRCTITYENKKTPMAPYLFFLCAGTYDSHTREFEYPGGSKFSLELLLFPGSDTKAAEQSLEILHNAILWIHIFTGKHCYENIEKRRKLYELCLQREKIKSKKNKIKENTKLANLRKQISALASSLKLGYKYTGTIYREIGMQNSNFGGMENVGNTTITANRIMPHPNMPDGAFEYMIAVKAHEFYHNINGSEVTGRSPFELWLNEAATVFIEDKYMQFCAGAQYSRLSQVMRIISPDGGTLDFDTGAITMPILAKGFNSPDELISDVTYSKGPEFIRMVESIAGKEKFAKALAYYHKKYSHSNASTKEWVDAISESTKINFSKMADSWLTQTGYPTVHVKKQFNAKKKLLILSLRQTGFKKMCWQFPFSASLYDAKGNKIAIKQIWVKAKTAKISFPCKFPPAFISFCPSFLFYGKINYPYAESGLYSQLKFDADATSRYMALEKLAQKERMQILQKKKKHFSKKFMQAYFSLLADEKLTFQMGTEHLAISSSVEHKYLKHRYHALHIIRENFRNQIAKANKEKLLQIYFSHKQKKFPSLPFVQKTLAQIKARSVKNASLSLLSSLGEPKMHKLILSQFKEAKSATDKYAALSLILDSKLPSKMKIIKQYEKECAKDPVQYEVFLSLLGGNDSPDAIKLMKWAQNSPNFDISQSNEHRMFMRFAHNKRLSMQTSVGRAFLKKIILRLANINEYSCVHILSAFSKINDFPREFQPPLVKMLFEILKKLDSKKVPFVYNTIRRTLKGAPKAVKEYEKKARQNKKTRILTCHAKNFSFQPAGKKSPSKPKSVP
ncbi:DUF3458 domain-containing protein [Candidatus Micrarchaeota archaeon CG10_big_fil_rev_8_21_14_0_10_45_29]|nr:MAG: DUF3458 domain-containing protein [Candidatus Micrarchaeota archaeon CG10_big_fil_rev_8_21_14_0_10_45_29]